MSRARTFLCALVVACLIACASSAPAGPEPAAATAARAAADVVSATVTPEPPAAEPASAAAPLPTHRTITLAEVLSTAESDAAAVLTAAAQLDAAAGRLQAATGALIPGVAAQFGASRLDGRQVGSFGDVDDVTFSRFEPSVGLFYRVNPGAALERSLAAGREAAAASLEIRDARRIAMLEASTAYFELVFARASLEIARGLEADAKRFHAIADARAVLEVGPGSDVARAEVELARARQTQLLQRARWQQASVRLATLLRWPPRELLAPAGAVDDALPADAPARTVVAGVAGSADAAEARPDLRAARARATAAQRRNRAAWWDLFGPDLDAAVGGRLLGVDLDDLDDTFLAYGRVRFSFDFGELGRARAAAGEARAARVQAEALDERVRGQIERVRADLTAAAAAVPEARRGMRAAERNARIQIVRFEAGTGLGIEVIDAQNTLARTRGELAEAVLRYNAAQLRLLAAMGRLSPDSAGRLKHVSSQGSNSMHGNAQSRDPAAQRGVQH